MMHGANKASCDLPVYLGLALNPFLLGNGYFLREFPNEWGVHSVRSLRPHSHVLQRSRSREHEMRSGYGRFSMPSGITSGTRAVHSAGFNQRSPKPFRRFAARAMAIACSRGSASSRSRTAPSYAVR